MKKTNKIKNFDTTQPIEEDIHIDDESYDGKNFNILRVDNELFDEGKYVPNKILNVKLVTLPKQGLDWHVIQDKKVLLVIKGTRLTKSEKEFLSSPKGMVFLINEVKSGVTSVSKIRQHIKLANK